MKRLFIHKLALTGKGKPPAEIVFKDGLNVISGASDTGKTFIFQSLYYMLGSDQIPKTIPQADGYTTFFLEIGDEKSSYYRLQRSISGADFLVKNLLDASAPDEKLSRSAIYELLSRHLDLTGKKLKKNKNNETVKLGFPAIRRFLMIDEKHIITESSPIFGTIPNKQMEEKSAFKFMLSGIDDSDLIQSGDTNREKIKKAGKKTAYDDIIQRLTLKIGESDSKEIEDQKEKITQAIQKYLNDLGSVNSQVTNKLNRKIRNQDLIDNISSRQRSISINLERFNLLLKTYRSDIDRINFVIEGKHLFDQLNVGNCPYCGIKMDHIHAGSEVQPLGFENLALASKAEVVKIRALIVDLESTIKDLSSEYGTLSEDESELKGENRKLEIEIGKVLSRTIEEIKEKLQELNDKRDELNEISIFHNELVEIEKRKAEELSKPSNDDESEITDKFDQDFLLNEFCKDVEQLLKDWNVSKTPRVTFSLDQYDIVIDGKARRSFGKGFRAILYTSFLMGLRNLAKRRKTPNPGLMIIDSPLTTHEEADEIEAGIQESVVRPGVWTV